MKNSTNHPKREAEDSGIALPSLLAKRFSRVAEALGCSDPEPLAHAALARVAGQVMRGELVAVDGKLTPALPRRTPRRSARR